MSDLLLVLSNLPLNLPLMKEYAFKTGTVSVFSLFTYLIAWLLK